jgi:hypothetical protein
MAPQPATATPVPAPHVYSALTPGARMSDSDLTGRPPNKAASTAGHPIVFDFVFVILCIAGLLGLLAHAALHEDDGKLRVCVRKRPNPTTN